MRLARRMLAVGVVVTAMLAMGGGVVSAQQGEVESLLDGKVRIGDEIVVPAGETISHDLYALGGRVRIEGTVQGDVVAFAGQVDVTGTIEGDLLVGAGSTTIGGSVGGDARVGTGQLNVAGTVGEDLLTGAGQVSVIGEIGEDLVFGAGQVSVSGAVSGSILGSAGEYSRSGTVGGTEEVQVGERERPSPPTVADLILSGIRNYVAVLLVGALLIWMAGRAIRRSAETVRAEAAVSAGIGLLGLAGFGVAVIAAVIVMIVLSLAFGVAGLGSLVGATIFGGVLLLILLAFALFVLVAFLAQVVIGYFTGRWMVPAGTGRLRDLLVLAVGLVPVVLVASLPYVGPWANFVMIVVGLGAMLVTFWRARRKGMPGPAEA